VGNWPKGITMALSEMDTAKDLKKSIDNVRAELSALECGVNAEISALTLKTHAGTVIAASAQIENGLEKLLLAYMRPLTKKEQARLFQGYGPLSSFAAKTDVTYALKMIPKPMFDALNILRRLRNEIAHSAETVDLSHPRLKPFFERLSGLEESMSGTDEQIFLDCAYSIGVSLGSYIGDIQRKRKAEAGAKGKRTSLGPW
jgi:DNA-binding MltR family transcriptional regulator